MTEQQKHLETLLMQREELINEANKLNSDLNVNREKFLKIQGVLEYLSQLGVKLPDPNEEKSPEEPVQEVKETEVV